MLDVLRGGGQLRERTGRRLALTSHERGARAEVAVADYLFARGFAILGRNIRLGALELDVVARRGSLVIVAEVRTRRPDAWVGAFASVTRTKRQRLNRAVAQLWRTRLRSMTGVERVRIDVASVTFAAGATSVDYIEGALS